MILIFVVVFSFLVVGASNPPNRGHDFDLGGLHPFSLLVTSGGDPPNPPKP